MNISDVIFSRRPAEQWARALFFLLSVIFHIFIAYYFITAEFDIKQVKIDKKIILVRPISRGPLVFPSTEPPRQEEDVLRIKPLPRKPVKPTTPTTPAKSLERKEPGSVATGELPPGQPSMPGIVPAVPGKPGIAEAPKGLIAPFNPSYYLKPENLEEVFNRIKREEREKAGLEEPVDTSGAVTPFEDNIVIDSAGRAYFESKGIDITPWARKVVEMIDENWSLLPGFGTGDSGSGGEVGIAVAFNQEGRVVSDRVTRSSGMQYMDQAALNAVRMSGPYPPLPGRIPGGRLNVFFLFNYQNE